MLSDDENFDAYFSGAELIGDNFSIEKIREWFNDEAEGYASLGAKDKVNYQYVYHALNKKHGFSNLTESRIKNALGVGAAYGHEFLPIINRIDEITIIDPSENFETAEIAGVPIRYKRPNISGTLPVADCSVDLLTCFGVLHHIPNVTYVVSEFGRVLVAGGKALIREPIINMGDWRKPRKGLTARERGIPVHIMDNAIKKAGMRVISKKPCDFPVLSRLVKKLGFGEPYNSNRIVDLDAILSDFFFFNARYNRSRFLGKISPCSVFWVCEKL